MSFTKYGRVVLRSSFCFYYATDRLIRGSVRLLRSLVCCYARDLGRDGRDGLLLIVPLNRYRW